LTDILLLFALILLVIEDGPLNNKLLCRELIMDKDIIKLLNSAAKIHRAQMLVQKLARYIHSLHNLTTNMWNVNLWRKDILPVLFQYNIGGSVTSVVTMDLSAEDPGKIFGTVKDFFRVQSAQTDSGPTQPPMKWLPGVLNPPR
jgi:hypothetical protein